MRSYILTLFLVLVAIAAPAMDLDVSSAYVSKYVFRGERLIDNPCYIPSLALVEKNFEFKASKIYDSSKKEYFRDVFEAVFKTHAGKLDLDMGFIRYAPRLGEGTNEFFTTVAWKGQWHPSVTAFFDFEKGSGKYIKASLERNVATKPDKIVFGASVGYVMGNGYMGVNKLGKEFNGLYDGELYLKSSVNFGKHWYFEPIIAYSFPLSSESKFAIKGFNKEESSFYGGVNVHFKF